MEFLVQVVLGRPLVLAVSDQAALQVHALPFLLHQQLLKIIFLRNKNSLTKTSTTYYLIGEKLAAVGEELADVLCYALAIANELGIDVTTAMQAKMVKNSFAVPTPNS